MLSLPLKMDLINQDARRASAGSTADRRTTPNFLSLGYFTVFCGYHLWIAGFHNYAVETFHISALHVGYLFSVAALPGTFAFLIGLIARKFSLSTLMIFACAAIGVGLIGIGLSPNCYFLWPGVIAIGIGFTCVYPIISSICIAQSDPRAVSTAVGHMKSYGPLAALTACFLIFVCLPQLGYRSFFVLAGIVVVLMGLAAGTELPLGQYSDQPGRLRFKKDLWPYYALNFLTGCRSAGIAAFVLFLLVREHGMLVHQTVVVVLISNFCSLVGYRLIGLFADRYSPPKVLSYSYLCVSIIFLGFCFINSRFFLILFYLFDSLLVGVSVLTDSHLKGASRANDTMGDLASGFTLFHLGKAMLPLAGGVLWNHFNQQATFLVGSILAGLAIWVSRKLVIPESDIM